MWLDFKLDVSMQILSTGRIPAPLRKAKCEIEVHNI